MQFSKQIIISLLFIIVIACLLRFTAIDTIPRGLHWDEAAYAYNAFSLMQTGKDEWGMTLPWFLRSFGDWKPALLSYLIIPSFYILGVSNFAARAVPAFLGIVSIIAIFGLILKITKSQLQAVLAAFIIAITPWHIHYSRSITDPIIAFCFLVLGLWGWFSENSSIRIFGAILLVLSMYTYNSSRIFVPLLLLGYFLLNSKNSIKKLAQQNLIPLTVLVGGGILIAYLTLFTAVGTRVNDVLIFTKPEIIDQVNEGIFRSQILDLGSVRIFNNKLIINIWEVVRRYVLHYQADFLFFQNNLGPRHAFSKQGNVLFVTLPLLFLGLFVSLKRLSKEDKLFGIWLLLAAIPAALTTDVPHSGRTFIMLPALIYFICQGFNKLVTITKHKFGQKIITISIIIVLAFNTTWYIYEYFLYFPEESEYAFQGYFQPVGDFLNKNSSHFDQIYIDNQYTDPYIFIAWYTKEDPWILQKRQLGQSNFGKYIFSQFDKQITHNSGQKNLYIKAGDSATFNTMTSKERFNFYNRFGKITPSFTAYY